MEPTYLKTVRNAHALGEVTVVELREYEEKMLKTLYNLDGRADVNNISKISGLAHSAVMRATLRLSQEQLVRV